MNLIVIFVDAKGDEKNFETEVKHWFHVPRVGEQFDFVGVNRHYPAICFEGTVSHVKTWLRVNSTGLVSQTVRVTVMEVAPQ